jgi:hypothetical protein
MMYLAVFCHDELSPFAQHEECLSVSKLFGVPQIAIICGRGIQKPTFRGRARNPGMSENPGTAIST